MIGETYGNYRIVSQIGMGGMGAVYLAEHQHLERRVAIKVLLPEHSRDPEAVQHVLREARATALIRHPGIVEVFDCEVGRDGRAFIVMELLDGTSLGHHLKTVGRLDTATALFLTELIANVLSAVHEKGIIHRDLKPDNVFLLPLADQDRPFAIKVLDFGIAKLTVNNPGGTLTRTGHVIGSPPYMSPEQCRGVKRIDHRADIYSLGCILYEMLCGRPPFVRQGPGEVLVAHVAETPARPSSLQPTIPPSVDRLLDRMLAKSPSARQSSMREVETEAAACRVSRSSSVGVRVSQIQPTQELTALPFQPPAVAPAGNGLETGRRGRPLSTGQALLPARGMNRESIVAMLVGVTLAIVAGVTVSRFISPGPLRARTRITGALLAVDAEPPPTTLAVSVDAAPFGPPWQETNENQPNENAVAAAPEPPAPPQKRARPRPRPRGKVVERVNVDLMTFGSAERLERPSGRLAKTDAARKRTGPTAPSSGGQR